MSDSSLTQIENNNEALQRYKKILKQKLHLFNIDPELIDTIIETIDFARTTGELEGRTYVLQSFKSEFGIDEKT